jgi:predicted MFS family arabinose efflux permease
MASTTERPADEISDTPQAVAPRRNLLIIFLSRTALNTAHPIVYRFLPSIARGLGLSIQAASGLVTLPLGVGMGAPILGAAGDWHGRRRTMEAGLFLFCIAGLLLTAAGSISAAVAAFALYGLSHVLYDPAVHAYSEFTSPASAPQPAG